MVLGVVFIGVGLFVGIGMTILIVLRITTDRGVVEYRPNLTGRVAVVTGTTSGIGKETALKFAQFGAHVFLLNRSIEASELQAKEISQQTNNPNVESIPLDLNDFQSVSNCCELLNRKLLSSTKKRIDYLVLNAGGVFSTLSPTVQGFEKHWGINHLGHFLLTMNLLPLILQQQQSDEPTRIIAVSSLGHMLARTLDVKTVRVEDFSKNNVAYQSLKFYGRSKLANILFMREMTWRFPKQQVQAFSVHPGVVETNLGRNFNRMTSFFLELPLKLINKTAKQGAQTTLHCCLAPINALENGGYYADRHIAYSSSISNDVSLRNQLWNSSIEQVSSFLTPEAKRVLDNC